MKYSILGFNQEKVVSLQLEKDCKVVKLDVNDLLILKDIADFMNRSKIIKYTIDDKVYFSIQYTTILEDLPILNIKKQALSDRLDKMVYLGLLEKKVIKNQAGTFVAFRMGVEYENLLYSCTSSETLPTSSELQVQAYQTTTHNTNITNTNNIEKEDNKLSSKKNDDEQVFIDKIYALYPTKCPKRGTSLGKSRKDKERIKRLLKLYSMDEIEKVVKHEIEEKYEKQYMQNFSTFLNNFPDPTTIESGDFFGGVDIAQGDSKTSTQVVIGGQIYR